MIDSLVAHINGKDYFYPNGAMLPGTQAFFRPTYTAFRSISIARVRW